jgi:hypothetical protein
MKTNITEAIKKYTEFLFPDIAKDKESFGVLKRERTHLWDVFFEIFWFAPLKDTILVKTPVLCLYAGKDRILNILYETLLFLRVAPATNLGYFKLAILFFVGLFSICQFFSRKWISLV